LHQSTQLCIERLEEYVKQDSTVLDLGCGSGILSIISLLLGAKSALSVDIEPGCIKVVSENAAMNNISMDKISIKSGNLLTDLSLRQAISGQKYDIILANIVADVIIELAPFVRGMLKENGVFISSGIIDERLRDVHKGLEENGFKIIGDYDKDVWACVVSELV
ncbi:MAG: 50S ribosomal protein L11 methyltransferase, partial [Clostridiales bacterium]|nr:50S ribosomal protein L11 methyltransferase [Clostridiales bacterium]